MPQLLEKKLLQKMLELIGWIGGILFAICGAPQAWACFRQKHACGVSGLFLALWTSGELCCLIYTFPKQHWPLIVNYALNLTFLMVIIYYKIKGKPA